MPLILIPQLLLSGFLRPLDDLYINLKESKPVVVSEYDKYQRNKDKVPVKPGNGIKGAVPIEKQEGMGEISVLANFITSRWTIDAMAHQVSLNDLEARDALATRITVSEYEKVLNKESVDMIERSFEARVSFDLFILVLFSLLFLFFTMIALKQKDSL